jgi:hypothetical protein
LTNILWILSGDPGMTKYWLVGVAVATMTTGTALAQAQNPNPSSDTTVTTRTTTDPALPIVDSVHTSKTQNTIDSNGVQTDKRQTFTSGSRGTDATASTKTIGPDGRPLATSNQERIVSPNGDTTTTDQTTATPPR